MDKSFVSGRIFMTKGKLMTTTPVYTKNIPDKSMASSKIGNIFSEMTINRQVKDLEIPCINQINKKVL